MLSGAQTKSVLRLPQREQTSPEDYAGITALLHDTINADRFPMSPRIKRMRVILHKLDPPEPTPLRHPSLKPYAPSMFLARKKARRRA